MFPKQIRLSNRGISITLGLISPFFITTGFALMHTASLTRIPQVDMEILDNQPADDGGQYKAVQTQFNKELYPGWEQRLGLGFTLSLLGLASGLSAYQLSVLGDGKFKASFTLCTMDVVDSTESVNKTSKPDLSSRPKSTPSFSVPPTVIEEKEEPADTANPFPVEELDKAFVSNTVQTREIYKSSPVPPRPLRVPSEEISIEEGDEMLTTVANYKGHLIFASRTQSGKTSTILGLMDRVVKLKGDNAEFRAVDPKGSLWGGLEKQLDESGNLKVARVDRTNPHSILPMVDFLDDAIYVSQYREDQRMEAHQNEKIYSPDPYITILDEWLIALGLAAEYDRVESKKRSESIEESIISKAQTTLFGGAEDAVLLWIIGQDHRLKTLKFKSTGVRNNMAYFALGRGGDLVSIEGIITDKWVVPSSSERERLSKDFNRYREWSLKNPDIPIFYTSLGGHRICRMPDLTSIKSKKIFTPNDEDALIESIVMSA